MGTTKSFSLLGCGRLAKKFPKASSNHSRILGCYAFVLVMEGGGRFYGDSAGEFQLNKGDMFMLFPGESHRYGPGDQGSWFEYWFMCDGLYLRSAEAQKVFDRRHPLITHAFPKELAKNWLKAIKGLIPSQQTFLYIVDQLVAISDFSRVPPDALPLSLSKALGILEGEAEKSPGTCDIRDMLEQTGLHYDYIRKLFRSHLSTTPLAYFQEKVIQKAEQLLREKNLSVVELAARLGYHDVYYFSRLFKKKNGLPPGTYRKQYKYFED